MDTSSWDAERLEAAWEMASRVAAFSRLYDAQHTASLTSEELHDLILWTTGDEEAASQAEEARALRRQDMGMTP